MLMEIVELAGTVVVCDHCGRRALSRVQVRPGQGGGDFHDCPALGILAPLVPEGTRAKVEKVEREDYAGKEHLTLDADGRPIMSVITTRDDGQDCAVFAPLAKVTIE